MVKLSIRSLRKSRVFLKNLGWREKNILKRKGVKLQKPEPGVYEVVAKNKRFSFTYGSRNSKDWTIIG